MKSLKDLFGDAMKLYGTLSVIVLSLFIVLCLTGAATAASIVTQNGNDYTVILDPNLHADPVNGTGMDINVILYYNLNGTGNVVYTETVPSLPGNITVGDLIVSLSFTHPSNYLSDISISVGTSVENVTINLVESAGRPLNIEIIPAMLDFNANVTIEGNNYTVGDGSQIEILNPTNPWFSININNLKIDSLSDVPIVIEGGLYTSASANNLNVTGLLDFSGYSYSLYIENSTFIDGGLKVDGTPSLGNISFYINDSNFTNSSISLGQYVTSSNIVRNRISNGSNVLQFSNVSAGTRHMIYNNYFEVSPSQPYVSTNNYDEKILFYCDDGIFPGTNIVGGPYIAGNYWSYSDGSGYSDGLSSSLGYVNTPYTIPSSSGSVSPGLTFTDPHPLTKYTAQSNNGGNNDNPLKIIDPDPTEQDPTKQGPIDQDPTEQGPIDQDPTSTKGQSSEGLSGRKGLSGNRQLIQGMKEAGQTLNDALIPMGTGAVIVGASAGSVLMMLANIVDLFFDVTSKQTRKGKLKFKLPKLSNFLTANSAFSLLFFFLGVCIVDMLLGNAVEASMDHGFLMPIAAYVSALFVGTIVNIGGGLLLDEIMDYVLDKIGIFVNSKTGILDLIAASRHLNALLFIFIFICAIAVVMFSIYLFDWSLV